MTKVLVAGMYYETNTFAPGRGSLGAFRRRYFRDAPDPRRPYQHEDELAGAYACAGEAGITLIPGFVAYGSSGPIIEDATYIEIQELVLASIRNHLGEFDGVYIRLHGAMVTESLEDAEGELLRHVRAMVGDSVIIAVSCDLHCHFTDLMAEHADIVAGYQTFPHRDQKNTGYRTMKMLANTLSGELLPQMSYRKLRLISTTEAHSTEQGPMREVMSQIHQEIRLGSIVDATIFATQPWLDVTELGWAVVVMTDGRQEHGQRYADQVCWELWARREQYFASRVSIPEAIDAIAGTPDDYRPVIVADGSDSPAAGSTGDGVEVLAELMRRGFEGLSYLAVVDAPASEACFAAGVGKELEVSVGGTLAPQFFKSVRIRGRVTTLCDGKYESLYPPVSANAGRTAVIAFQNMRIVITQHRVSQLDQQLYLRVGLDLRRAKVVVVKSAGSFRAYYEPIAAQIIEVAGVGPADSELLRLPFTRPLHPLWPFEKSVSDPLVPHHRPRCSDLGE